MRLLNVDKIQHDVHTWLDCVRFDVCIPERIRSLEVFTPHGILVDVLVKFEARVLYSYNTDVSSSSDNDQTVHYLWDFNDLVI